MIEFIAQQKGFILILSGALLFFWECYLDFRERHEGRVVHISRNLIFSLLNSLALGLMYAGVLTYAYNASIFSVESLLVSLGFPAVLIYGLLLLIFDLVLYFWHRANHVVPFLWRFHRVHHSDRDLDFSSAVRFHFGELVLSMCLKGVLVFLLGISPFLVAAFDLLVTLFAMFNHSNVSLGKIERAVRAVIVTPRMHRVHHHPVQQYTDSNYSTMLSLWDSVFGSYRQTKIDGEKIGLTDYQKPPTLKDLFTIPFW